MGFLDKLAKSFGGKKEPDPARPAESRGFPSSQRITPQRPTRPVSVPANGGQGISEKTSPPPAPVATAVAVVEKVEVTATTIAEQPEVAEDASAGSIAQQQEIAETAKHHMDLAGENLFTENFDQDLDDAFDSLVSQDSLPATQTTTTGLSSSDEAVVVDLFADIAANYARPVKNFIFELKRGTATKEWIEICRPAMQGIRRSAEGMGLTIAAQRMVDVETALSMAQGSENRVLSGEIRDLLLTCYEDLIQVMPQAFVVGEEEQQREGVIINALLMQIPNMGHVTVEKLFRAGLTSLETLFLAQKDDLAAATGINPSMSELICKKFQSYRAELEGSSRELGPSGQRARLAEMLDDLRRFHEGFQLATENEWSNPALASQKREYRQQRQSCSLRINVLLAEMGELGLVNELQKFSFERRIQQVEEYLASPCATV